jgi:hypothetical protein
MLIIYVWTHQLLAGKRNMWPQCSWIHCPIFFRILTARHPPSVIVTSTTSQNRVLQRPPFDRHICCVFLDAACEQAAAVYSVFGWVWWHSTVLCTELVHIEMDKCLGMYLMLYNVEFSPIRLIYLYVYGIESNGLLNPIHLSWNYRHCVLKC